jgi:hypothetical protein
MNALTENGFTIKTQEVRSAPRPVPDKIKQWWRPEALKKPALYILIKGRHPDADGEWCFIDEASGKMLIVSFSS